MGIADQKQFIDAVAKAKGGPMSLFHDQLSYSDDWVAAFGACNRLAMFDMLPAMAAVPPIDSGGSCLNWLVRVGVEKGLGEGAIKRITFAEDVVENREIEDQGLPNDQVNDAREFLGCTRLDDDGVRRFINDALGRAGTGGACCQAVHDAWVPILVNQRRVPGGSLISNLAAAAHYMLARYHVCAAKAYAWQMKVIIDGYDDNKRRLIAGGDRDLKQIALTGNRPFPPDFAIRNWAYKGADDGEADRVKCNSKAIRPVIPDVNGQEL